MTLALYVPAATPLHRLHPVTKLAGLVALVAAAFLVDDPRYLVPIAALVGVLLVVARAGATVGRFQTLFVLVFAFTVLVWTLFYGAVLVPTWKGFWFGLSMAVRLDTFLAAGLVFLAVTRVEEVAYALGRLGVPYKVGFTLTLSFRLVPLFFDAAGAIVQAQRCRGLRFDTGGVLARLRRFVPVIVPVFVGALRRADHMAMALELRGFNSGRRRTTYIRTHPTRHDVLALALATLLVAAYVALWVRGFGTLAR